MITNNASYTDNTPPQGSMGSALCCPEGGDVAFAAGKRQAIEELVDELIADGDRVLAKNAELIISRISDDHGHIYDDQLRRLRLWSKEKNNATPVSISGSECRFESNSRNVIYT